MTVGETLTEARCQAGLSVDEVSERTRIRPTVIRSIEQDDYAACGGELYVRGYVRAIAGAVGIDALPLISQFDQAQLGGAEGDAPAPSGSPGVPDSDATRLDLPAPLASPGVPDSDATRFDLHAVADAGPAADPDATRLDLAALAGAGPPDDPDVTRFDLPAVPAFDPHADPDATRFDLPVIPGPPFGAGVDATAPFGEVPSGEVPPAAFPHAGPPRDSEDTRFDLGPVTDDDLMAAGYQLPGSQGQAWQGPPWQPAPPPVPPAPVRYGQAAGGGTGRRAIGYTAIAVAAAAALVVLAVHLAGGSAAHGAAGASPSRQSAAPGGSASASASAHAKASATAKASAAGTASKPAAAARVTHLPIAAARAFGPDGFADGDNPGLAGYTIAANPAQIWSTQWYATADFGMLKHGTGLLLDLGSQLTITGVRFDLTQYRGASLQIKVGNGTAPQSLRVAASAKDTGGVVRLALPHPQLARYLVIWFTLLAPDGAGHFQESVSHVAIAGHR